MDILKAFELNNKKYNINILWEIEEPLFRAHEIAKILDISNIRSSIENFDEDEKVMRNVETNSGTRCTIFLTESGVYRLLMNSRKPITKPFQKWLCKVIKDIRKNGKYELDVELRINEALKIEASKMKHQTELLHHNSLIEAFRDRYIVYIGKIKEIDNKILIKIGSTKEIQNRTRSLIKEYESFNLIKIFECLRNEAFEKFLHKHQNIIKHKYNSNSNELFLVSNDELDNILKIAAHNKFKFNTSTDNEQIIEIEKIKLNQMKEKNRETELAICQKAVIEQKEENLIDPTILLHDFRRHTQVRGAKIQKYSPDGKNLIKTYESYAYVLRDTELNTLYMSRISIKNAIKNKLIYKNFRWAELDRKLDDNTLQDIGETIESKNVKIGYTAMLNLDKDKIVKVFCDQKEAGIDRKFTSSASIANAIRRQSQSGGHYFMMWDDCNEELKQKYLELNELPTKRVAINGVEIEQLHPLNKNVIKVYSSYEDVIKEFKIARKTLKSACEFDIISKGYKWRFKK